MYTAREAKLTSVADLAVVGDVREQRLMVYCLVDNQIEFVGKGELFI